MLIEWLEKVLGLISGIAIGALIFRIPPIRKWYNRNRLKAIEKEKAQIIKEQQQEQATFRQAAANIPKPGSYEEFRAKKLAEQEAEKRKRDQGGFVDLDAHLSDCPGGEPFEREP